MRTADEQRRRMGGTQGGDETEEERRTVDEEGRSSPVCRSALGALLPCRCNTTRRLHSVRQF